MLYPAARGILRNMSEYAVCPFCLATFECVLSSPKSPVKCPACGGMIPAQAFTKSPAARPGSENPENPENSENSGNVGTTEISGSSTNAGNTGHTRSPASPGNLENAGKGAKSSPSPSSQARSSDSGPDFAAFSNNRLVSAQEFELRTLLFSYPIESFHQIARFWAPALRHFFWHKDWERYHGLLFARLFSETEIIQLRPFMLEISRMLRRHVTFLPRLTSATTIKYLAEDMIDGGDPELVAEGKLFLEAVQRADRIRLAIESAPDPNEAVLPEEEDAYVPAYPHFEEADLIFYTQNPLFFFQRFVENDWILPGEAGRRAALIAEILEAPPELGEKGVQSYYQASVAEFMSESAQILADICAGTNHYEWSEFILRVMTPLCRENAWLLACKRADLYLQQRRDPEGLALMKELHKNNHLPVELRPQFIQVLWQLEGQDATLRLAKSFLRGIPDDLPVLGVLAEAFLKDMAIDKALILATKAHRYNPRHPLPLFTLARAFHAGYFSEQADLCMNALKQHPAYQANSRRWFLPNELFIKCTTPDTVAFLNQQKLGPCPVRLAQIPPGEYQITWLLPDSTQKEFFFRAETATVHKYKFCPEFDTIDEEISRDGSVTLYHEGAAVELKDLVKPYLVATLTDLPDPDVMGIFAPSDCR
jgi:hypothetical protein